MGAHTFTNYQSQQTLFYVIVDISSPPTSTLSLFNFHVTFSQSSGQDTIRLLQVLKMTFSELCMIQH